MANNHLTLFCLVEGETISKNFSVKPTLADTTIDDLRQRIRTENPNTFIGLDAKDLTLWSVSIPDDDDGMIPVLLNSIIVKERLKASRDLSDVWEKQPAKGFIHVFIQRTPPAAKRDREEDS
ncbi:hypothetical protein BGZ97_009580, partial [Linnemannia gamsii]